MPLRLLLLLLTFILLAPPARAQSFEPGWLVRSTGDTLRGEIENGFWEEPPPFIWFRATPGSPDVRFMPRQLRLVNLEGGRRFRYEALPIDHAADTRYGHVPRGLHPNVKIDSVLAEVLLEGPVQLLRVAGVGTTHYLLRRAGLPVLDLSERLYLRQDATTGKHLLTDGNNYHAQLAMFFGDCPAAESLAGQIPFTPAGLLQVAQAYTAHCTAPVPAAKAAWRPQTRESQPVAIVGGVLGGVRYTYSGPWVGPAQLQPFAGIYGESFLPGRRLAVYGELSLNPYRGQSMVTTFSQRIVTGTDGKDYTVFTPVYTPFSYRSLLATGRVGLRYHYPRPQQRQWFIGAGLESGGLLFARIRPSAGLPARPDKGDLYHPGIMPRINLGTGWRTPRLTMGADVQLLLVQGYQPGCALRLSTAYRLTRHPDAAGWRP